MRTFCGFFFLNTASIKTSFSYMDIKFVVLEPPIYFDLSVELLQVKLTNN